MMISDPNNVSINGINCGPKIFYHLRDQNFVKFWWNKSSFVSGRVAAEQLREYWSLTTFLFIDFTLVLQLDFAPAID